MTMHPECLLAIKLQIAQKTGLLIRESDEGRLREVIAAWINHHRLAGPEAYLRLLQAGSPQRDPEWQKLVSLITVGESYFFRDKGQFALLKEWILPELIAVRQRRRSLKIWSAGCATGEEPYSVAILVEELLPQRQDWQIRILGTDINPEAIDRARRGIFPKWSFRMCGEELQQHHFKRRKEGWEISERVRRLVEFRTGNLLDFSDDLPAGFNHLDLLICRNVFIYFNKEAILKVMAKFARLLNEGGYLLTGHGELQGQGLSLKEFRAKIFPGSVIYQKASAAASLADLELPAPAPQPPAWPKVTLRALKPQGLTRTRKAPDKVKTPKPGSAPPATPAVPPELEARFRRRDYAGTISLGEKIIQGDPNNYAALHLLAQVWANVGEHGKAAGLCRKMMGIEAQPAKPYFLLAHIMEAQGDHAAAKKLLKKVIYLDPTFVAAYLELSGLYERERDGKRAATMRQTALALLMSLAPDTIIEPYQEITAAELVHYLREKVA